MAAAAHWLAAWLAGRLRLMADWMADECLMEGSPEELIDRLNWMHD